MLTGTSFNANKIYGNIMRMNEKMCFTDHKLARTGRTSYSQSMNIVGFSCINFELTSIKQTSLNKQDLLTKLHFINN